MSGSENNAHNLHRSRSTTSVKDRKKHPLPSQTPDPEISRVHALIAAHRAMDRSQSRSSTAVDRSDSKASRRAPASAPKSQNVHFSPAAQLRRQRSALQSRAPHLSAALRVPPDGQQDDPYLDAVASDFGAVGESYGSEPSSYRRLRRARSMLTPRRRLFENPSPLNQSPLSQAPTLRNATSSVALTQTGLGLRIKRSLTFLRPASRASIQRWPDTHLGQNDEAVRLARTQFLSDMEETRVKRRSSLLHLPKIRHSQKAFQKSVRSSQIRGRDGSMNSETPGFDAIKPAQPKRSFSATLRDRVCKAFGKSGTKPSLPPQQMVATRQHFSEIEDAGASSFDDYHVDEEDDRRESFYVPSRTEADTEEVRDRFSPTLHTTVSRESLHSNSRSRVTSWTNSSVTSLTTRGPALERNRLSIIKEDGGPHQPSCSAGRHLGGINVFQDPLETENEDGEPYPPVDSQRIYSALMKRIGEEEAEIEQTEAALEEIHQRRYADCNPFGVGKSTIRAVSTATMGTEIAGRNDGDDGSGNQSQDLELSRFTPAVHKQNSERRKAKLASQEEQSSFFPFSDQGNPPTQSPFRKLLEQRRSEDQRAGHGDNEILDQNEKLSKGLTRGRYGLGSESIYSQTTNGGENPSYITPVGSSEDFAFVIQDVDETGMVTIMPARSQPPERLELPSADSNERREWKGWLEGEIDASLGRRDHSKAGVHYREYAQIDPEDVQISRMEVPRPGPKSDVPNRFPLLDLKEVPRNSTPVPKRSSSLTRSQIGLLKKASVFGMKSAHGRNHEDKKISGGIRKLSPGNLATVLKEKKSQMLMAKAVDVDKENKPITTDSPSSSSPPMSTPGRFGLQMRSGNGRLRKRASDMAARSGQKHYVGRKNISTRLDAKTDTCEESPTDRVKQSLSARLSRPFNMDVPESNRPFDSMFLGKQDFDLGNGRLSTAPNIANTRSNDYGGLELNPSDGDREDTALPQIQTPSEKLDNVDKGKNGWSSKRMVSDFLRKRRLGRGSSTEDNWTPQLQEQSTAAFV